MDVKLIPGTKGFMASTNGVIYDALGIPRKQYTNGDGYKTVSVLKTNGKWQTFGVHRLVALAHIEDDRNKTVLVVNHKDHNLTNNQADNLEWTTDSLNNIHAALFRGSKENPTIIAKSPENKHEFIANIQTVSKRFNLDVAYVWDLIKNGSSFEGWSFKHFSLTAKIPNDLRSIKMDGPRENGRLASKSVRILNIETREIDIFDSVSSAARYHLTDAGAFCKLISNDKNKRLFKRKYLIVYADKKFPILTQAEYEKCLAPGGKEIIAYNTDNRTVYIYESASKFIRENKLSKKTVTVNLKKNRLRLLNNWWFLYNNEENHERLKSVIGLPGPVSD